MECRKQQNIMEFLKRKVQFLAIKLRLKKELASLSPPDLLKFLLNAMSEGVDQKAMHMLAEQSLYSENYPNIIKLLMKKLQAFAYDIKSEQIVANALTIATHLVKAGNQNFANDFRKNKEVLKKLQQVDVHYFENSHPKEKKQLEYCLQCIRQRASFLRRLLQDQALLEFQRRKTPPCLQAQESQSDSVTVNSLITPMQSPHKSYRVKFTGVSPAPLEGHPFQQNDIIEKERPPSHKSSHF